MSNKTQYSRTSLERTPPYNGHFFQERIDQNPHRKPLLSEHLTADSFSRSRWCPL